MNGSGDDGTRGSNVNVTKMVASDEQLMVAFSRGSIGVGWAIRVWRRN
jgi:hypothetical protein